MNYEKLEQLMSIPKKTDASKAKINEYLKEMECLLSEEGLSKNAEKYLWSCFSFCGAKPLSIYMKGLSKEKRSELFKKITQSVTFQKNEKGASFKMPTSLLGAAINEQPEDIEYISALIKWCMAKSRKKDGTISNENTKIIEKYFVCPYEWNTISVSLSSLTISKVITKEFCEYFASVLTQLKKKKMIEKIDRLTSWLQSENKTETVVKNNKSDVEGVKTALTFENESMSLDKSEVNPLLDTADQLKSLSIIISQYAEKQEKTKKEFHSIKAQLEETRKQLRDIKRENTKINVDLKAAQSDIIEKENELSEMTKEIERLKMIIGVYSEDKKSSMDGQLNALASKLKTEYGEFKDAQDLEMTVEIGEILRDQLFRVFRILLKAGVDIEGR